MIRLLYNKVPAFNKWINQLVTERLNAYDGKADLELVFVLTDQPRPNHYYRYTDDSKMPLDRFGQLQDHLIAMNSGLSRPEIDMLVTLFEKNHEAFMNMAAGKLRTKPLSEMGFLIGEIKERKNLILHPDIFEDIVATLYLREDEIGEPFNQKIHDQKKVAFQEAKKKGRLDPFHLKGLSAYLPSLESLADELKQYLQDTLPQVRAQQNQMKRLILEHG